MGPTASKLEQTGESGWVAGARAKGEFRCLDCGYGVTVYRVLPSCPMCRGSSWERVPWRPGARELLADLRSNGVPTALVTMSWRRFAEAVVEALPPALAGDPGRGLIGPGASTLGP